VIGPHPGDEAPIELYEGRYGLYVKHGGVNATVPRDLKPEELTVEQAVSLLAERAAKGGGKKPRTVRARKAPPAAANDAGDTAKATKATKKTKKKAAPKRKAKADAPPRTGTVG
jgi:DNA topoisomerase-1